jgi:hypothetical protein
MKQMETELEILKKEYNAKTGASRPQLLDCRLIQATSLLPHPTLSRK